MKELGIYIHIPFCKKKCEYCDFISFENKQELVEQYIEKLKQEVELESINATEYKVSTIYIGGGTPSYIKYEYIEQVMKKIKNKFNIDNAEITIEVNPGTVNREKLQEYYNLGINRLSIGLQATENRLLKTIGRIHTYEEFIETYNFARQVGFKNINVDLMIGLPTQTIKAVEMSLKNISELKPEHISVYSLIVEEGTKLERKVKNKELTLPNENTERKMYWLVKEKLEQEGYVHYEISNFSKGGYESKHNLNCWNQKEYIGFGVAAHSYLNKTRYSNTEKLKEYLLEKNKQKIINEKQIAETQMKEYMLLGLRKIQGVKISEFKSKFIENPIYIYRNELNSLEKKNLIEIDVDQIKLTKKGLDLANIVWEQFI